VFVVHVALELTENLKHGLRVGRYRTKGSDRFGWRPKRRQKTNKGKGSKKHKREPSKRPTLRSEGWEARSGTGRRRAKVPLRAKNAIRMSPGALSLET